MPEREIRPSATIHRIGMGSLLKSLDQGGYILPLAAVRADHPEAWRQLRQLAGQETIPFNQLADFLGQVWTPRDREETPLPQPSFLSWLFNPRAVGRMLSTFTDEVAVRAETKRVVAETRRHQARVQADGQKLTTLFQEAGTLEQNLGSYIQPFCRSRNCPVPEKDTPEMIALLMGISAEMLALQAQGEEFRKGKEALVRNRAQIQAQTERNRMLAGTLPEYVETVQQANLAREIEIREKARHLFASTAAFLSGAAVGAIVGLYSGIEKATRVIVEKNPRVGIALAAGLATFATQFVAYQGTSLASGEILELFVLKSAVVTGVTAIASAVVSAVFTSRQPPRQP